ncbi:MAG: MurR/RpiR family transcriptional regulator, partial [Alphaproteobacteria bacterium]|nr:MurR/RpiR family transcriptional regulator [Alphaproteobacteria bacterium]
SRIVLYGRGHSTALVDLMGRRLRRSGLNTIQITHVGWETGEKLIDVGRGDVFLAFAFRWPHKGLSKLLEHAGNVGATSILISDLIGPTIRPVPDIVLAASRGSLGESQSLTVPMAICNAIILVIAQLDGGKSVESLARLAEIRQHFLE